jgi:hypothetical protein
MVVKQVAQMGPEEKGNLIGVFWSSPKDQDISRSTYLHVVVRFVVAS